MGHVPTRVTESNLAVATERLHYIDWLRVLAMLSIFLFHCDRFFNFEDWHVKNNATSLASSIHISFFTHWMMPLFFVLSGAAIYYALRSRTARGFVRERTLRILIPLITVGYFVTSPPQIYFDRLCHSQFSGTFFQFYPRYFEGLHMLGGNFAWHGVHLWYLLYLFIFSLILLPLFVPGKKSGRSVISRLAALFEKPWAFLLLFLPLAAVDIFIDMAGLGGARATGGWCFLSYILFLIYGHLIYSNLRILEIVNNYRTVALVVAVVLSVYGLVMEFVVRLPDSTGMAFYMSVMFVRALRSLCWIVAILGFGSRFLNFNNRFLRYANEAVLPFYILHQMIILTIGFFVVRWTLGIAPKYIITVILSFTAIMAVYEPLIRRFNLLRFLFGMRLKK
ncbi:MAG: acyltransferase family protein [Deltaproteobacteria bacterium]|nr:MAG: acyltransferase family protein [Deltaproteobacteria bacterium]